MNNPFEKIKLSQLYELCKTIANTQVRDLGNIKRIFCENELAFDETLALLTDLKIVKKSSADLELTKLFSKAHNRSEDFKLTFVLFLFSSKGEVSESLRNFFLNFETENNSIFFKANEKQKIKYSDTRNLLLELEFIFIGDDNATYIINPKYADLFIKQFCNKKLSPQSLKRKQAENDFIGLKAEKAVVEYEKKRLRNILINPKEIVHISLDNVLAGYDIKSFENYIDENSNRIDRYIEVKAISIQDVKFYWSKNEIDIAKVLGEKYFLYLLPVVSKNTFDFSRLMIINNPFKNIYLNETDWKKTNESISFSKNHKE